MPYNSKHPLYKTMAPRWQICRDVIDGEYAVKSQGTEYLPQLGGQEPNEYSAYKQRADFFEATGRAMSAFVGLIFGKDPVIKVPEKMEEWLTQAGQGESNIDHVMRMAVGELLGMGRCGILVERPPGGGAPYLVFYSAEQIINWGDGWVQLQSSSYAPDSKDPYEQEAITTYVEIRMTDGRPVQVQREEKDGEKVREEEFSYTNRGEPIDQMPFFLFTVEPGSWAPAAPPLLPLANKNLSHYRTSADLEHGRHWTALPTPYISGMKNAGSIAIGSGKAIVISDPQGRAGFMEFTGQGLKSLENAMQEKEQHMAVLGAKIIQQQRKGIEAAETARIHQAGEVSILANIASIVAERFTEVLKFVAKWERLPADDISVEVNTDYIDSSIDDRMLVALTDTLLQGKISQDTYLHNLQRGELLPPGVTIEDEKAKIEEDAKKNIENQADSLRNTLASSLKPEEEEEEENEDD